MINSIKFKFGRAPQVPPEPIDTTAVTVFVGPNHSGKTRVLQELFRCSMSGRLDSTEVIILDHVGFAGVDRKSAEARVDAFTTPLMKGETLSPGDVIVGKRGSRNRVLRESLIRGLVDPISHSNALYLSHHTMMLDGPSRIGLVHEQAAGDLQSLAQGSFQVLFRDHARRAELRRIVHEAFGKYLVIDPTHLGRLRLRLSDTPRRQI
jgi:hypothetical protein